MSDWTTALVIGVCIGALIGVGLMRYSLKAEAISGGPLSHVFHYLACAFFGSSTPFIITAIVVGIPFLIMFGTAVALIATAGLLTFVYGVFESQAATA